MRPLLRWHTVLVLAACGCAPSDTELRNTIVGEIAANPATWGTDVIVEVRDRHVFLSGRTSTLEEQQRVLDVVRSVKGTTEIVNEITLVDSLLAEAVKEALLADPLLSNVPIEVEAQDGTVSLTSDSTDRSQRERAVQVASAVRGVRSVEDRMK